MSQLAAKHNAINLSQGFPVFDGPHFIKQAAIADPIPAASEASGAPNERTERPINAWYTGVKRNCSIRLNSPKEENP